jgi:hypothetical protein
MHPIPASAFQQSPPLFCTSTNHPGAAFIVQIVSFFPFFTSDESSISPLCISLEHPSSRRLALLSLYPCNILPADCIPRRHVLVHTLSEALLLAVCEGRAGFWDALLEAVLIEFLFGVSLGPELLL